MADPHAPVLLLQGCADAPERDTGHRAPDGSRPRELQRAGDAEQTQAPQGAGADDTTPLPLRSLESPEARAAFVEELFARFRLPLLRYLCGLLARRADAEDVLQETYARLLAVEALDRTLSRARSYLFTVATNLAHDRYRRRLDVVLGGDDRDEDRPRSEATPEDIVELAQALDIVRRTLLELKPRCRTVFVLRTAEGLGYEEIAARLGISKRTVEREIRHALDVCQRRLERRS